MFISGRRGNTRDGSQWAEGLFLVLCDLPWEGPPQPMSDVSGPDHTRTFVVWTRLKQCGHFMGGAAYVDGMRISLSGTYGNDGLTREVPPKVYAKATPLPLELYEQWKHGGGHNSAGSEATAVHAWAQKHVKILKLASRADWRAGERETKTRTQGETP